MPSNIDSPLEFISDIAPFFHKHRMCYVDVGAHKGKVFKLFAESELSIGEAFLFEPNPDSFAVLQQTVAGVKTNKAPFLFNLAVGDKAGMVQMQKADTMTKVVATAVTVGADDSSLFSVDCKTLDEFSNHFTDQRISVLKLDVEGFEAQVLAGAAGLLSQHKIDVIYIEAGLNPAGTQQTYYRIIDDIMQSHGYRIFKIYEQKYEWVEDSPFLRRMNIAYFSPSFAAKHPYKITHELYLKSKALAAENKVAAKAEENKELAKESAAQATQKTATSPSSAANNSPKSSSTDLSKQLQDLKKHNSELKVSLTEQQQKVDIAIAVEQERAQFYRQLYEETKLQLAELRKLGRR